MLVVISATFFMVHAAPGGPFDDDRVASPEILEQLNETYNLNDPLITQLGNYLLNAVQGDFGPSYKYPGRTVSELIASGLPITVELAFYAVIFALLLGILSGIIASLNPGKFLDHFPMSVSMIGICVPSIILGPILILIFGIWFEILPVSGWGEFSGDKILPTITLGSAYAAIFARLTRGGMLEILAQDFIRTARAKGLTERMVVIKHAMQGGLIPVVSFLGPAIAGLLAGSFVVETIFQIPGLGRFYVEAAFNRDYTMILGTTIFFSAMIIFFNLLSDLAVLLLNPRARENL